MKCVWSPGPSSRTTRVDERAQKRAKIALFSIDPAQFLCENDLAQVPSDLFSGVGASCQEGSFQRMDTEMNGLGAAVLFGASVGVSASAQLTWFNDQEAFEAAAAGGGSALAGVEDYEASTLGPASIDGFDDSLEFGIPNGPDGFPYSNGTDGLAALTTQSNTLGASGDEESPSGANGLSAASDGFLGVSTDVILSGTFIYALDLIFSGDTNSAVGGNIVDVLGGQIGVNIRVYDTKNNLLGEMVVPGDAAGSGFAGFSSTTPVGRVSLFSVGGGAEGMDNVQLWLAGDRCAADLDGDGDADADDFFRYLDAFAAGDLDICDIDGDADCDADDFFGYLDRFAEGC